MFPSRLKKSRLGVGGILQFSEQNTRDIEGRSIEAGNRAGKESANSWDDNSPKTKRRARFVRRRTESTKLHFPLSRDLTAVAQTPQEPRDDSACQVVARLSQTLPIAQFGKLAWGRQAASKMSAKVPTCSADVSKPWLEGILSNMLKDVKVKNKSAYKGTF